MVRVAGGPLAAAQQVSGLIASHRVEAEDSFRMASAVREAAGSAGMFALAAPRVVGGWETALPELYDVFEELGSADPTVAWHAGNSLIACTIAAYLPEAERKRVFADLSHPFGYSAVPTGAIATAVDDGYELTGRWPFVTGCQDAKWLALWGVVHDSGSPRLVAGQPDARVFLVSSDQVSIEPTWDQATAMRATGSHAVSAERVFIPDVLAHRWDRPKVIDSAFYRLPTIAFFVGAAAAIALGALRSALAGTIDLAGSKVSRMDGTAHADKPRVRETIAFADAAVRSLRLGLRGAGEVMWSQVEAGTAISAGARAGVYSTMFYVFDVARDMTSRLYTVSTSAAYSGRNPVERALRDVHAITAAVEPFQWLNQEAGYVVLGHESTHPRF